MWSTSTIVCDLIIQLKNQHANARTSDDLGIWINQSRSTSSKGTRQRDSFSMCVCGFFRHMADNLGKDLPRPNQQPQIILFLTPKSATLVEANLGLVRNWTESKNLYINENQFQTWKYLFKKIVMSFFLYISTCVFQVKSATSQSLFGCAWKGSQSGRCHPVDHYHHSHRKRTVHPGSKICQLFFELFETWKMLCLFFCEKYEVSTFFKGLNYDVNIWQKYYI